MLLTDILALMRIYVLVMKGKRCTCNKKKTFFVKTFFFKRIFKLTLHYTIIIIIIVIIIIIIIIVIIIIIIINSADWFKAP